MFKTDSILGLQAFKARVDAAHASRFKSRSRGGKSGGSSGGDADLYALDDEDADLLDANDGGGGGSGGGGQWNDEDDEDEDLGGGRAGGGGGAAAMPLTSALGVHSVSVRVWQQ